MQARKNHEKAAVNIPDAWTQEVKKLLVQNYSDQCQKLNKTFEVYGQTFPSEVLIAASFLNKTDQLIIPVTFIVSADLEANQNQEKLLKSLIDTIGMYFDKFFADDESLRSDEDGEAIEDTNSESHYIADWEEAELNKVKFWYQVTRENIGLTQIADDLLDSE